MHKLKAIICACAIESNYRLEKCRSEIAMQIEQLLKTVWYFKSLWVLFGFHVNLLLIVSQTKSRRYVCGARYDFFFLLIIWGKVLGEQKELVPKICYPPPLIHSKFASQNTRWRLACNDTEQAITSQKRLTTGTFQKQLQTSGAKKSLLLGGRPVTLIVIQWFWIALILIWNKALHPKGV